MRYVIYFTWNSGTKDSVNVENAEERNCCISNMISRKDFSEIYYCAIYKNGEYGKKKKVI